MPDLLDLLDVITAAPTTAPQGYTSDPQWSLADLDVASEALCAWARVEMGGGTSGIARWSHSWSRGWGASRPSGAHRIEVVTADLRCDHYGQDCECMGDYLYRTWCWDCERWSVIATDERTAVEDIHDHCWPGWRDLPVGPPLTARRTGSRQERPSSPIAARMPPAPYRGAAPSGATTSPPPLPDLTSRRAR